MVASTSLASLTPYIDAMKTCAADINALNLPYPFLGLGANSNSVDSTLDACMGVPEPNIKGDVLIKPGVGTMLLSPAVINNVAVSNGLGQPPPTTGDSYVSGSSNSGSSAAVVIENPDGTTTNFEMGTSGSNGVATETSNDTAANQVWTQTNTIAPDGTTTVASTGHGNTLAIDGATISEPGQRPSDPAISRRPQRGKRPSG